MQRALTVLREWCITKDTYDKKHQEYADKIQLLNVELEEHTKADYDYQTTVATVVSIARRAKQIFESSEDAEKRVFLSYLLQNSTVAGKTFIPQLKSPFDVLLDYDYISLLPWLDTFRTLNWVNIKQELQFSGILSMFNYQSHSTVF